MEFHLSPAFVLYFLSPHIHRYIKEAQDDAWLVYIGTFTEDSCTTSGRNYDRRLPTSAVRRWPICLPHTSQTITTTATVTVTSTLSQSSPTVPSAITAISGDWAKFTPGDSLVWSLERDIPVSPVSNTGLAVDGNVYDVDLFNTTPETIQAYKGLGKKVICYFTAGSWDDCRPDSKDFDPACYCNQGDQCKMAGWPEYWFDLTTPSCVASVRDMMAKRIALAKSKGCDAVEPDNTDSYINKPGWANTIDDQFSFLEFLSQTAHDAGLAIGLKNGPDMIKKMPQIVEMTDFVLIESCAVYDQCDSYSPFVDAGKAAFQVEYEKPIDCSQILDGFYALAYSSKRVDYQYVTQICTT